MMAGFGRDAVHDANLALDTFDVAGLASKRSDLVFTSIDGGADTLVTGAHQADPSNALVLKGITATEAQANGHFTFKP